MECPKHKIKLVRSGRYLLECPKRGCRHQVYTPVCDERFPPVNLPFWCSSGMNL
jgi:hypothetical protein